MSHEEVGSAQIAAPLDSLDAQSSSGAHSLSEPSPLVTLGGFLLALMAVSATTYAWLFTDKMDRLPQWFPPACLTGQILPAGLLIRAAGSVARFAIREALSKLPARSNNPSNRSK